MTKPLWSILIAGVPNRFFNPKVTPKLLADLYLSIQIGDKPIELLYFLDNKKRSVGAKRNALLNMAQGTYLSFIDDDDEVSENYVSAIIEQLNPRMTQPYLDQHEECHEMEYPDVICFKQKCLHVVGGYEEDCAYSLKFQYESGRYHDPGTGDPTNRGWWRGLPSHTMVLKSELARQCRFPGKMFGEDVDFCRQFAKLAKTEVQIDETLYTYIFNQKTTETRG